MSKRKTVRPGVREISPVSIYGEVCGVTKRRLKCSPMPYHFACQVLLRNSGPLDLIADLNLVESDANGLTSSCTYCNDSGTVTSSIDHFLCSNRIDKLN